MISLGKKWFGGKDREDGDADLVDLRLDSMRVGDLVDYDLKTWQVTGRSVYDYDGFPTREWELTCADEVRFLERAVEDGRTEWTLTRSISVGDLEEDVVGAIVAADDPPEAIHFEGRCYEAVESASGIQRQAGDDGAAAEDEGRAFINWSFEAEGGRVLFLVQWGERQFSAYEGEYVEEYSFTDILPGGQR